MNSENKELEPKEEKPSEEVTGKAEKPSQETKELKEDSASEANLKDKHGQEGISKAKYEREMAAKDAEIEELKKQVSEAVKTEEGRKALEEKLKGFETNQADMRTEYELKLAGCRDDNAVKAAKALLSDYEGDITKLKTACPYLFEVKKTGSTGGKPAGATQGLNDAIDRAFAK